MAALNANSYYQQSQVSTASRGQLLLMVYDGLLRFLAEAHRAMAEQKYEIQSTNITKAQALLMELLMTLDHTACPDVAANLDRLYRYMYDRLTHANVNDDLDAVMEVARLLAELREAWAEADRMIKRQEICATVGGAV